jgi:uncharacterized protein (TIGR04145 family)
MGDEDYFIVPDHWFDEMDTTEPDMIPGTDSLEQNLITEESGGTEPADQSLSPEQGGAAEPVDQNTNTSEPESNISEQNNGSDQGNGNETTEQNLYAAIDKETYLMVADNTNSQGDSANADDASVTTDTTDKTNNGQGTGSDTTDKTNNADNAGGTDGTDTGTGPVDLTNPITDPDDVPDLLDPLSSDNSGLDSVIDQEPDPQTSNLDLKKPGYYGTWSFTVWSGLDPVGSGFYTRTEGEPDQLELNIPLSSVSHQYDGITEITMRIKKLGPQMIMCAGADTEPYIGVMIGAGIAMLSAGAYSYKKKRPFASGKEGKTN